MDNRTKWTGLALALVILCAAFSLPAWAQDGDTAPYEQSPWWPYLSAHMNVESPPPVAGGPIELRLTQEQGGANWVLPSPRELDPTIFGAEGSPKGIEAPAVILGAPMEIREVQDDGTFIVNQPTPFGDDFASTRGTLDLTVVDATATDGAATEDQIDMVMTFRAPGENGGTYRVEMTEVSPHGWFIPTAGGVATNILMHGLTAWGSQLMPTEFAFVAFWGPGDIYLDDELIAEDRLVHGMLTEYVRDVPYDLVFDEGVNPNGRHFHLIVPPFTAQGEPSPVPTGYMLDNGEEQPFLHVMLTSVTITDASGEEMPATPPPSQQQSDDGQQVDREIEVIARNYVFEPGTDQPIELTVGESVRFRVTSPDIYHTFTVKRTEESSEILFNLDVYPDDPGVGVWTPTEPGTYYLYCVPHVALGMVGTIVVNE